MFFITTLNLFILLKRNNSEKLAIKIREQATAIVHLNTEKEKYVQDIEILQQQLKKASHDLENSAYDKEKIKVLFILINLFFKIFSFSNRNSLKFFITFI